MSTPGPNGRTGSNTTLSISGMTCSGCAATVTRILSRVPGTTSVKVDIESHLAVVAGSASPDDLISAVTDAGYGAQLSQGGTVLGKDEG